MPVPCSALPLTWRVTTPGQRAARRSRRRCRARGGLVSGGLRKLDVVDPAVALDVGADAAADAAREQRERHRAGHQQPPTAAPFVRWPGDGSALERRAPGVVLLPGAVGGGRLSLGGGRAVVAGQAGEGLRRGGVGPGRGGRAGTAVAGVREEGAVRGVPCPVGSGGRSGRRVQGGGLRAWCRVLRCGGLRAGGLRCVGPGGGGRGGDGLWGAGLLESGPVGCGGLGGRAGVRGVGRPGRLRLLAGGRKRWAVLDGRPRPARRRSGRCGGLRRARVARALDRALRGRRGTVRGLRPGGRREHGAVCGGRHRPLYGRRGRPRPGAAVRRGAVRVLGMQRLLPLRRRARGLGRYRRRGRSRSGFGSGAAIAVGVVSSAAAGRVPSRTSPDTGGASRSTGPGAHRSARHPRPRNPRAASRPRRSRPRPTSTHRPQGPLRAPRRSRTTVCHTCFRGVPRLGRAHDPVLRLLHIGGTGRAGPRPARRAVGGRHRLRTGLGGRFRARGASRAAPPLQLRPGGLTVVHALPRIRPRPCAGHHHLAARARSGVRRPTAIQPVRGGCAGDGQWWAEVSQGRRGLPRPRNR